MQTYAVVTLGENRGKPRVWIEGARLNEAGFEMGLHYSISVDKRSKKLVLSLDADGERKVSGKMKNDKPHPVIDITTPALLEMFEGEQVLKVVYEATEITISKLNSRERMEERAQRLLAKIKAKAALKVGSLSTGVGALSLALHLGLAAAGIKTEQAFACEIDQTYIEQCAEHNPVWAKNTIMFAAPMQEVVFDRELAGKIPEVDILEAGIPCAAHSAAGKAKKGLVLAEDDPKFGHLVTSLIVATAITNPSIVVVENVKAYANSASFAILRNQLTEWGYDVHVTTLKGEDFNTLERRERMAMVAVTQGIAFDFDRLKLPKKKARRLGEALDHFPVDHPKWGDMPGLVAKQERDKAAGKGFMMQLVDEDSPSIGTLTRGYAKIRSTDPKVKHPVTGKLRQLTAAEHARCKDIPPQLIAGMSETRAHEVLGQSIVMPPFIELGRAIGVALQGA